MLVAVVILVPVHTCFCCIKMDQNALSLLLLHLQNIVLLLLLLFPCQKREWVREIFRKREELGEQRLVEELHRDPEMFHRYFRMDVSTFHELLNKVKPYIEKKDTNWRNSIPSAYRLAITLRYLATGDSQLTIALSFRVGHSTVGMIIEETCEALWKVLMPEVLKPTSSPQEWENIANDFYRLWDFPLCLGSLDGKHIVIQAPSMAGSEYFNYKGSHSIVLLAACDARYCFTLIDIGDSGRHSDGGVFSNAEFGKKFTNGQLNMPSEALLPGTSLHAPYCLIGDAAFPLRPNLMRPFPGKLLPHAKSVFNYRLSRARRVIENAFGILATRWRVFRRPIIASPAKVISITKAACCLHNYLQMKTSYASPYVDREDGMGNVIEGHWRREISDFSNFYSIRRAGSNMYSRDAAAARDLFTDYFVSNAGRLPYQDAIVTRT